MRLTKDQASQLGLGHLWPEDTPYKSHIGPRPSKYRNVRSEYNSQWYASKAEANHAAELDFQIRLGGIDRVERQPRFELGCPENVYIADFKVWASDGRIRVVDVKGFVTPKFKRDLRLWRRYGEFPLWVIMGGKIQIVEGGQQA